MNSLYTQTNENDLDGWFNDLDDQMVEIINKNLIQDDNVNSETDMEIELEAKSGYQNEVDVDVAKDRYHSYNNKNNHFNKNDNYNHNYNYNKNDDFNINKNCEIDEYIYIEDILEKDIEKIDSNTLIQYECCIAYFIQVLMEGTTNNKIKSFKNHDVGLTEDKMADIIIYLKWISNTCKFLATKISQELLIYKSYFNYKPTIIRSSYNFCTKYTQCKNFYSKYEIPTCTEHHYVHSLLKYDVDSVIIFMEYMLDNTISLIPEEINNIYLSVKTICFVTRHMAKEISYIDYITKNNSETFHRSNPIDVSRRKNLKKNFYTHINHINHTDHVDYNEQDKHDKQNKHDNHSEIDDSNSNEIPIYRNLKFNNSTQKYKKILRSGNGSSDHSFGYSRKIPNISSIEPTIRSEHMVKPAYKIPVLTVQQKPSRRLNTATVQSSHKKVNEQNKSKTSSDNL